VANGLTKGQRYRFKYRAENFMGFSDFSDNVRVGLGPLPSQPSTPIRASLGNSDTSIGIRWNALTS